MISAIANSTEAKLQIAAEQPFRGLGEPADIVGPALFLASEDAGWITGHCLAVEGGYLAR
jgi:NAD(P)-dependent dehydrogenase (short-subunit alcohol dehydrogenase family)